MRDHRKLRAFHAAHELVLAMYRATVGFPSHETFGLRSQLRRGAVSIASNLVEGSARQSKADYVRFVNMSFSAAKELQYQWMLARDLAFVSESEWRALRPSVEKTVALLAGLQKSLTSRT